MNLAAVEDMEARFPDTDVVLIESGGDNLTLTFSPALVDFFIYVIDVAAGDKIPRKNGPGITPVGHPGHQQDRPRALRRRQPGGHGRTTRRLMRGDKPFVFTNCKTGEGIAELVAPDPRERPVRPRPERGQGMTTARPAPRTGRLPGRAQAAPRAARSARSRSCACGSSAAATRSILALDGPPAPRCSSSGRSTGTRGCPACPVVSIITNSGRHPPGRPLHDDDRGRPRRPRPRHDPGGDQDPRDGRQLRRPRPRRSCSTTAPTWSTCPTRSSPSGTRGSSPAPASRIAPTATLLYSEILMAGRKYYGDGELFQFDLFSSTVRAERPDGDGAVHREVRDRARQRRRPPAPA